MRSPDQYRAAILAGLQPTPVEQLTLTEADGCVLAADVASDLSLPQFDNSAMDGYAVRADDVASAAPQTPVSLEVLGDIPAGAPTDRAVRPGTALRIMTGAPMPDGADTVVKVEDTDGGETRVMINASPGIGANIRRAGEDIAAGARVLERGVALCPRQIGLLAAIGRSSVPVHRQPTVVVMPTGSELIEPGQPERPGFIYDSNGPMLASAIRATGARTIIRPAVTDDPDAFAKAVDESAGIADLIITTGGVSMGAYDIAKAVLTERGTVSFEKVAMNPGMPQGFGHVNGTPIITLPGNPVSAYVSFEVFVRPAIRTLQGHASILRSTRHARATVAFHSPAGKTQFVRALVSGTDHLDFAPMGVQGSHVMGGLGAANAIAIVPEQQTHVEVGEMIEVIDLREGM